MVNGLTAPQAEFLERHHSAAMITIDTMGTAKAARVGVALVRDRIWSSGTQDRVRTRRLRVNPRSTLFVFGGASGYLTRARRGAAAARLGAVRPGMLTCAS
jgi:hypothetical protein